MSGGEELEQVVQKKYPILGNVQDQFVWGFEKPGLVQYVSTHSREVGSR